MGTRPRRKSQQAISDKPGKECSQNAASPASIEPQEPRARSLRDNVSDLLKDEPIYVDSIGAGVLGLEQGGLLREWQHARGEMIRFYMSEQGGKNSLEVAAHLVNAPNDDESLKTSCQSR